MGHGLTFLNVNACAYLKNVLIQTMFGIKILVDASVLILETVLNTTSGILMNVDANAIQWGIVPILKNIGTKKVVAVCAFLWKRLAVQMNNGIVRLAVVNVHHNNVNK